MTDSIRVATRMRPFNAREKARGATKCITMDNPRTTIANPDKASEQKTFSFDYSYDSFVPPDDPAHASQATLWRDIGEDVLENAWRGFNCSLLAYGQTGAGKSYSMMGYGDDKGIIPIACDKVFARIAAMASEDAGVTVRVEASMLEIYRERVKDLFDPSRGSNMKVRNDPKKGFYVESLSRMAVDNYGAIERLLEAGAQARTMEATNMNATSSRAHTIFQIHLTQTRTIKAGGSTKSTSKTSAINLVDLAGSERADATNAEGERFKEGIAINQSLTTLGNCIEALAFNSGIKKRSAKKKKVVPFRNSALTMLLANSLGGNAKTIMIAAVSPADINYEESMSTLRYADRAKKIKTKAVVNEDANAKVIKGLQQQIEELQKRLAADVAPSAAAGAAAVSDEEQARRDAEVARMREELEAKVAEEHEAAKSWEERLRETEAATRQREEALARLGILTGSERERALERAHRDPHISNLNEDPQMNGQMIHFFEEGTSVTFGRKDAASKPDVTLGGLSIEREHCVIRNDGGVLTLVPRGAARTHRNGELVTGDSTLANGDRLIFGNNHVYVVKIPAVGAGGMRSEGKDDDAVTWDGAVMEMNRAQVAAMQAEEDQRKREAEAEVAKAEARAKDIERKLKAEMDAAKAASEAKRREFAEVEAALKAEAERRAAEATAAATSTADLAARLEDTERKMSEQQAAAQRKFEEEQAAMLAEKQALEKKMADQVAAAEAEAKRIQQQEEARKKEAEAEARAAQERVRKMQSEMEAQAAAEAAKRREHEEAEARLKADAERIKAEADAAAKRSHEMEEKLKMSEERMALEAANAKRKWAEDEERMRREKAELQETMQQQLQQVEAEARLKHEEEQRRKREAEADAKAAQERVSKMQHEMAAAAEAEAAKRREHEAAAAKLKEDADRMRQEAAAAATSKADLAARLEATERQMEEQKAAAQKKWQEEQAAMLADKKALERRMAEQVAAAETAERKRAEQAEAARLAADGKVAEIEAKLVAAAEEQEQRRKEYLQLEARLKREAADMQGEAAAAAARKAELESKLKSSEERMAREAEAAKRKWAADEERLRREKEELERKMRQQLASVEATAKRKQAAEQERKKEAEAQARAAEERVAKMRAEMEATAQEEERLRREHEAAEAALKAEAVRLRAAAEAAALSQEELLKRMAQEKKAAAKNWEEEQAKMQRKHAELERKLRAQQKETERARARKRQELRERSLVDERLYKTIPLVNEANLIATELNKGMSFHARLTQLSAVVDVVSPRRREVHGDEGSEASDGDDRKGAADEDEDDMSGDDGDSDAASGTNDGGDEQTSRTDVCVRVEYHSSQRPPVMWSYDKFVSRLYVMRELFSAFDEVGRDLAKLAISPEDDPFHDEVEAQLIGTSTVYMEPLSVCLPVLDAVPIVDYKGDERGELLVRVIPHVTKQPPLEPGTEEDAEDLPEDLDDVRDTQLGVTVALDGARGLPAEICAGVFVKYTFFLEPSPLETPPMAARTINPHFDHVKTFWVTVTDGAIEYLTDGRLVFEIFGRAATGEADEPSEVVKLAAERRRALDEAQHEAERQREEASAQQRQIARMEHEISAKDREIADLRRAVESFRQSSPLVAGVGGSSSSFASVIGSKAAVGDTAAASDDFAPVVAGAGAGVTAMEDDDLRVENERLRKELEAVRVGHGKRSSACVLL